MLLIPDDSKSLEPGASRVAQVGRRVQGTNMCVEVYACAKLPTPHGPFDIVVFRSSADDKEHVAVVCGDVAGKTDVPVRIHSECLTGDVFGSLRCDCGEQLDLALSHLANNGGGVLLYLRQEGRGIGLGNKIRAYMLQEDGLDTVSANEHLGFDGDLRRYDVAGLMLKALEIDSVQLLTNNPRKIFGLRQEGIDVRGRIPAVVDSNPHNDRYLETKATKMGHIFPKA